MIQVFVKFDNHPTLVLNLEENYTISSKELFVKCCDLFFNRFYKKTLMEAINDGSANFIVNSNLNYQCKLIKFRSNMYYNTSNLKDSTIQVNYTFPVTNLTNSDIESIINILNGYY